MIAGIVHVLPGYFETVGMTLVRGRLPTWEEFRSGADVAVVSEAAARVLGGDGEVLGARFTNGRDREWSVIGVVGDLRRSLRRDLREVAPVYALPGARSALRGIVVRTRTRQDAVLNDIKREVGTLTPGVPVGAGWWSDSISNVTEYRNPRFQTLVLGGFATLALGVTALGVFAAVAFMVAARTHELGVRLAIGARPGSLIGLMIRATMMPVAIGLIGGIAATRWLGRLAEAQLFEVNARDPATLAAAGATVIVTALVAAWLPARRASRLDPLIVLKAE
jgi:MacB-like periplasmic core domain